MFSSFRARVFFLTTALVLLTALSISVFQQWQMEELHLRSEQDEALNLLKMAAGHIENQYDSYVFHRNSLISERKRNLKNVVELALIEAEKQYMKAAAGEISEAQAQKNTLEHTRGMRYAENTGYLWINTAEKPHPMLIVHPTMSHLEGQRMDSDIPIFNTARGKGENLFQAFVEACEATGEGYVDYLWPKPTPTGLTENQPKLSFVKLFKPWKWIIGTGLYLDDIEHDSQLRIKAIIQELRKAFARIKISENSYLFVFDSSYNVLVHPDYSDRNLQKLDNPATEKVLMDRLKAASQTPGRSITYSWKRPGNKTREPMLVKSAYVHYFAPLDWYIVTSVYMDEVLQPLYQLRWKIILIITMLLSLSLLMASALAASLSRPLQALANAALKIETDGISSVVIPEKGTTETIMLGNCLNSMLSSIKSVNDERDKLFQAIHSEEEKYRTTLHAIADAVISMDNSGRILGMNPMAEILTGWKYQEASGLDISEIYRATPDKTIARCKSLSDGAPLWGNVCAQNDDAVLTSRTGQEYHIAEQASLIRDEQGGIRGIVLVFRNTTDDYLNQLKLKEAEWKFTALFEHGPLGVAYHRMIYDEAGNPADCFYIDANAKYMELTGVDPRGKTMKEVFPGIEHDTFDWIGVFGRVAKTGKVNRFKQGFPISGRWFEGVAFQYKPDHFVAALLEITEQRKLEQQLQQAQKMDAVGQLAGGIAHDFNNVLSGIIGAAELLKMDMEDDSQGRKFINLILDSSQRAGDLIKKLMVFSRHNNMHTLPMDAHTAVSEAVALLECSIDKKIKIDLQLKAPKSKIIGDLSQLQTVFINLGINASHAMPDGGLLSISSSCINLDQISARSHNIEPGSYIRFEVRDTGCGIEPENLSRIFDPFFTTKAPGHGTGLGLSVSFGIVKQHYGSITVYSEPGKGTVFSILLPLTDSLTEQTAEDLTLIRGQGCILVVDDEEVIRTTVAEILRELGYEVLSACNGVEALEIYKKQHDKIALVMLDMFMPEMNGSECFKYLKEFDPQVKVIVASGFSKEEELDAMKENGLCGYIQKPYRMAALSQLLGKFCEKKS